MLATVRSVFLRKTSAEMFGPITKPIDEKEISLSDDQGQFIPGRKGWFACEKQQFAVLA